MVEDIFDPSNNKLTIEDRVSIAKKVIKSLGFTTTYDALKEHGDLESLAELSEKEKEGIILLLKPFVFLEIREDVIRISITPICGLDKIKMDKNAFEVFYNDLKEGRFTTFGIRNNCLEHSMLIPQISDEYFECYLRAVLTKANEICENVWYMYDLYRVLVCHD